MYVGMYVCTVCMYVCTLHICMYVCMYACMYGMYVCMYACMKIGIQCVTDFSKGKSLKQFLRNSFLGFFTSYILNFQPVCQTITGYFTDCGTM